MKNKNFKILIIDDEPEYQKALSIILEEVGYITAMCSNGKEALDYFNENSADLVITDLRMPVMSGTEVIKAIRERGIDTQILVITAYGSIESAVDAIKLGAADYFVKSSDPEDLIIKVDRIAKMSRLEKKNDILINNQNSGDVFLESKNSEFRQILDICGRVANTDISILLLGESGVGKEVVANYIHRISSRSREPFIPVNCQVFPEGVIESELFGHEKGAFTGALEARIGKFEEANLGTLFLDEIGDLPLMAQSKLLRALETKSIEHVGSNKRIFLDIRFIFATNKDLEKEIREGRFREDLMYRINALTLVIPPLRERKEDLPGLIEFLVRKTERDQKKKDTVIDPEVMEKLLAYDYPGNIRELKNIIERMLALSIGGRVTLRELPSLCARDTEEYSGKIPETSGDAQTANLRDARSRFEAKYIEKFLEKNGGNVDRTAKELGITTRQLWNKINQYDLKRSKR